MHRHRAFIVATWLALAPSSILFPETFGAEPKKDAAYYQNQLDRADWRWDESHEGLVYSMTQSAREYRIEMIRLPRADDHLTIRFLKGTRLVCSWDGHFQSVFVQEGNTLVYAQFEPTRGGCTLVAVNLDTGQELWRTNLIGVVDQAGHSLYSNRVQLYASDDSIMVLGMESRGNYAEIVDMKTGKTLAHRLYEQETRKDKRRVQRP